MALFPAPTGGTGFRRDSRPKLRPGQRARAPIRKAGKIARLNEAFRVRTLARWFDRELGAGQRPRVDEAGREWVQVQRDHLPGEVDHGFIRRRVGMGGRMIYKGEGIQVGHRVGMQKARRPDLRTNDDAVAPQSPALNSQLSAMAQIRPEEDIE